MTQEALRRFSLAVVTGGAFVSVVLLISVFLSWGPLAEGEGFDLVKTLAVLVSPYLGLGATAFWLSRTRLAAAVILLGVSLTTIVGIGVLLRHVVLQFDLESLLFLLLIVSGQWWAVGVIAGAAAVCLLIQRLLARRSRSGPKGEAGESGGV